MLLEIPRERAPDSLSTRNALIPRHLRELFGLFVGKLNDCPHDV